MCSMLGTHTLSNVRCTEVRSAIKLRVKGSPAEICLPYVVG